MSHSPFHQLFRHRRIIALSTLAAWALCAVLIGCLMGERMSTGSAAEHAGMAHQHATGHGAGHNEMSGPLTGEACCESEHDPVSLSMIVSLSIPLGLALALLLPHLRHSGTAWLRRQHLPVRLRPPRYHLVYCSLLH